MTHTPLAVFVIHDGFSLFGYGIARDLIRMAADLTPEVQLDVVTASNLPGPIHSSCGAAIIADCDLSVLAQAQFVFVCSSRHADPEAYDEGLVNSLRYCHRHGGWIVGLGTGVQALCQAGLLSGRRAAMHPAQMPLFQSMFPKVKASLEPFVIEDRTATCVGGDAVTDLVLTLLSQSFDSTISDGVRRSVMLKPNRSGEMLSSVGLKGSVDGLDLRLVNYIKAVEQTFAAPLPLGDLCAAIAVSPRTLARLTQSAFGCAPGQLATRLRLTYAADLLCSSRTSIQNVAKASGYCNASHFSQEFTRYFSIRPGKYRKHRQDPDTSTRAAREIS